jgi:predicted acylesterase/phospholipase RssA
LKAYGVFEGGGVKGVALAGAYKAALENNIEFIGFGGTSAGAIVALLAALNVKIDSIENMLVNDSFASFFENEGRELNSTKEQISTSLTTIFNARKRDVIKVSMALLALKRIKENLPKFGISNGSELKNMPLHLSQFWPILIV